MAKGKNKERAVQAPTQSHKGLVGVISLGCPKNLVDTERMLGRFLREGYQVTGDPAEADLLVVNTCGFVAEAVNESREAIREMAAIRASHPDKRLVVTGCLAQRLGERLTSEFPDIDLLIGSDQYDRLIPLLSTPVTGADRCQVAPPRRDFVEEDPFARPLATLPHTAYLKIAEGCSNPCAFCVIPALRGPYRSRPLASVVEEAEALAQRGVKELILISQDTTLYGRDLTPRLDLATLLGALNAVEGIEWIRLLYLYPTLINEPLLEAMASLDKVQPYLDMPLQHSHSETLARMKRAEREEGIQRMLERIRHHLPKAVLRTTFIVGFPGESEAEFDHLLHFVEQGHFDHIGVFTYSDEEGTAACAFPDKVPPELAEQRRDRLMLAQQSLSRAKLTALIGATVPVLVEGVQGKGKEQFWIGRTPGQAPDVDGVILFTGPKAKIGTMVTVQVTGAEEYDLIGQRV